MLFTCAFIVERALFMDKRIQVQLQFKRKRRR